MKTFISKQDVLLWGFIAKLPFYLGFDYRPTIKIIKLNLNLTIFWKNSLLNPRSADLWFT